MEERIMEDEDRNHQRVKVIRVNGKKPKWVMPIMILLVLIVLALAVLLFMQKSPLDKALAEYRKSAPGTLLSVQRLTGDNANTVAAQIKVYCKDFTLTDYYLAQIDNAAEKKSMLFILNPSSGKVECTIDRSANTQTSQTGLSQNVLATINGEPIYMDEVMAVYNNIPEAQRTNDSLQQSLDQVIATKLLVQDAIKKGINVSNEEVDSTINTFLTSNGLTIQQLEQNLVNGGSSMAAYRESVKQSLLTQKEIAFLTATVANPSDAEMKAFYDNNTQAFRTLARANTQQLLIYANASNDAQKLQDIQSIAAMLNATNFCELVTKYSQDTASVPRCGLYDFQEGQLLPEYEQVVFTSEPGSAKIIKTTVGYHIVLINNVTLPRQLTYDESKDSIASYLTLNEKQSLIDNYVSELRKNAQVVSYID
jgi:parvulin-like peptidyl-prolyl isomerase